jgi:hypothetical protein
MLAQDGTPMEKASYAFPEVRDYMLSLIREGAETFNVDGQPGILPWPAVGGI